MRTCAECQFKMELSRDKQYKRWRQRLAWIQHYLKARFNHKEKGRVLLLSKYVAPDAGAVVFDVGAHFGYLAKEFCRLRPQARIHCFEPVEYTRSVLVRVMKPYGNAVIEDFALSDTNGWVDISIPIKSSGNLGIGLSHFGAEVARDYIVEKIRTVRLDDYVADQGIPRLDFIKCDVEGAEFLVFKGGVSAIEKFRPVVYAEILDRHTRRLGYAAQDIFDFFSERNYRSFVMGSAGELVEVFGTKDGAEDYLFLPG